MFHPHFTPDNRLPRAIAGRVHANPNPNAVFAELSSAFGDFKTRHDGYAADVQKTLDEHTVQLGALSTPPGGPVASGGREPSPDPEYSRSFGSWFRKGQGETELGQANASGERAIIRAAMSVGTNSDGGYLAPVEWDRRISKALTSVSPLRSLCRVVTTTTAGYSTVWNSGGVGSGWVGETASRPQTTTPTLAPVTFKAGELYANPALTQQLLEDAALNIDEWLANEVADEFARQEAIAFVSGDGVNKPYGFLAYVGTGTTIHPGGEPGVALTGSATAITSDSLIDLVFGLGAPYRAGAAFLMNSATAASMRKLKDGQGNYLWQPSYILGQPQSLLGYPIAIEESMPNVGAGNIPVAFGAWSKFYTINDRIGTSVLRDPYTAKPYVLFYTRKRVGGGIDDPNAVRLLKVAAS